MDQLILKKCQNPEMGFCEMKVKKGVETTYHTKEVVYGVGFTPISLSRWILGKKLKGSPIEPQSLS